MIDYHRKRRFNKMLPRTYTLSPAAMAVRQNLTNARLLALKKHAVPAKGVLNPYGRAGSSAGDKDQLSLRPEAMKRSRLKLQEEKAKALEAHELQKIAREAAKSAMKTLIAICTDERAPEATRIAASQVILDRGYGKASQTSITANVTNGKASDITSDELDKRVNSTLKRVEELTNRAGKKRASPKRPINLREYN